MLTDAISKKVNEVIEVVNAQHDTSYKLLSRFPEGVCGAYRISEPKKQAAVLKFFSNFRDANIIDADPKIQKEIIDRLLLLGYPVPRYIHTGTFGTAGLYSVQQELPGKPLWESPTVEQVERLLSLLELQRNQAVSVKQDLSKFAKDTIFGDRAEKRNFLKNHSKEINEFLESMMLSVRGLEDLLLPTSDIVHGDFSYHNAMVSDGEIIGIIDWQEAGCGDWLMDLTRLIYSLHDRPTLAALIIEKLKQQDLRRIKLYTVYTVLDMVSWQIQANQTNTAIAKAFNKAKSAVNFVFTNNCEY